MKSDMVVAVQTQAKLTHASQSSSGILRRKCACGQHTAAGSECAECQQKREGVLQRSSLATAGREGEGQSVPSIVHDVLRSPGQPLDVAIRSFMEPRLGHDFSGVRVHTNSQAAESARAVNALAYTVGSNVAFAEGHYQPATTAGQRLLAHELAHVVQQQRAASAVNAGSLIVGDPCDHAEGEADRVANDLDRVGVAPAPLVHQSPSVMTLRRQPKPTPDPFNCPANTTRVRVDLTGSVSISCLPTKNGAVWTEYESVFRKEPATKSDKEKGDKEATYKSIKQPLLLYPPAQFDPSFVDVFVFFHGHRADYQVDVSTSGHENVALESHLQEAMAGTDRIGIAPQAPNTWAWSTKDEKWVSTWDWNEALSKVNHFDGLTKLALGTLQKLLRIDVPIEPKAIHVAGHSGGGIGIGEATDIKGGAKLYGDKVQDVTLQDAGYGFTNAWKHLMDWFLHGSPGKTVRVLVSHSQGGLTGGATRSVLNSWFNKASIENRIKEFKKADPKSTDVFEVVVKDPKPDDQKSRPGGFKLESHLEVRRNGQLQGTMVAFFAPGGGHYETAYASMGAAAAADPQTTRDFLGEAKVGVQYRVIAREGVGVFKDPDHPTEKGKKGPTPLKVLPLDTPVTVIEIKPGKYRFAGDDITADHARIRDDKGAELGWVPLAQLALPTQRLKAQP
jgi:Domain of unknown function (DUF4157)